MATISSSLLQLLDLPSELIVQILLQLPLASILDCCSTSRELAQFLEDENLWRQLVERDFQVTNQILRSSWKEIYQEIVNKPVYDLLVLGVKRGNLKLVNYAIERGSDIYRSEICIAAADGHKEIINRLLGVMHDRNIGVDYRTIMCFAASNGDKELVTRMLQLMTEHNITPDELDYNTALAWAAGRGQSDMVDWLLQLMVGKNIEPDYNEAMRSAAEKRHKELTGKFLQLMKEKHITPNCDLPLRLACLYGHEEIVELLNRYQSIQ